MWRDWDQRASAVPDLEVLLVEAVADMSGGHAAGQPARRSLARRCTVRARGPQEGLGDDSAHVTGAFGWRFVRP